MHSSTTLTSLHVLNHNRHPPLNMSALQVLLNDDLTRHVFYDLLGDRQRIDSADFPDPSTPHQRYFLRTCYALAQVCKGLSDAALDALWENLYSLAPLLRLLSSISYSTKEVDRYVRTVSCLCMFSF